MNRLGIQLSILAGPRVPSPLPGALLDTLESAEVHHDDRGRAAFELTLRLADDTADLAHEHFAAFNRVVLAAQFDSTPVALMDGFVTLQQSQPTGRTGEHRLTLTGEDVSLKMDLEDRNASYPGQDDRALALNILSRYAAYGIEPDVRAPDFLDSPSANERIPTQNGTDLEFLRGLAERNGFVFHVLPGPAPLTNTAYWGPPQRSGPPQEPLAVNMGPHSNVESIEFQHNALTPIAVVGRAQDWKTNKSVDIRVDRPRRESLAAETLWDARPDDIRTVRLRQSATTEASARARAEAMVERAAEEVVTAIGELDTLRYGRALQARALVDLRGAGPKFNGRYYVKETRHLLRRGSYRQRFTLVRGGLGSTINRIPI